MKKWKFFGEKFSKKVAASPEVREFLKLHRFDSPSAGACRVVAEGLRLALGEGTVEACCVWCGYQNKWTATHVVLHIHPYLWLDAEGAHTKEELQASTWSKQHFERQGKLWPAWDLKGWHEDFARPIPWSEDGVELFARLARETLKEI